MDMAVIKEIEALRKMTAGGFRQSCDEEFGEESRANGRTEGLPNPAVDLGTEPRPSGSG